MGLFDTFKKVALKAPRGNSFSSETVPVEKSTTTTDSRSSALMLASKPAVEKRLLFVRVPATQFQTLAAGVTRLQPEWSCHAVETDQQAAAFQAQESVFAVISGTGSLASSTSIPTTAAPSVAPIQMVLCAGQDLAEATQWTANGIHPVAGTIDAAGLVNHLKRIAQVQQWMAAAGMKKLLAQCIKLPVMPKLYAEVTAELDSPNGSIDLVAHHVAQDPVMTAKVLQVINSACFALGRQIHDPCEAVMFLGLGRARSLLLMAGTFSQFENLDCPGFSAERVWNHSLQVGTLAQIIALEATGDTRLGEAAFTSGLMHDMGKLILAANVPAMCAVVAQLREHKQLAPREAELQVLGTTHAELAACLLGTWALPQPILEAVAWHHQPSLSKDTTFTPLTAVHAANVLSYEMNRGSTAVPEKFDLGYLQQIGLADQRNVWREACGLPRRAKDDAAPNQPRLPREAKTS